MFRRSVLNDATRIFCVLAVTASTFLYLYPVWYGCAFPSTHGSTFVGFRDTLTQHLGSTPVESQLAPFRLLILADPQLEGDSSLPDPEDALLRKLNRYWKRLTSAKSHELTHNVTDNEIDNGTDVEAQNGAQDDAKSEAQDEANNTTDTDTETPNPDSVDTVWDVGRALFMYDVPEAIWTLRKRLDLFGNDYYLAHIFRTLHWWSIPTHVTVLGDLIGSQWVSDGEFDWRGWRFWNRVFAAGHKVEDEIMNLHKEVDKQKHILPLQSQTDEWSKRIINIVGNHDIGYAGDISTARLERFDRVFGSPNWDVKFAYPDTEEGPGPKIHLIVLNDMLLDTPAMNESLQTDTYNYINSLIRSRLAPVEDRNNSFVLLLTHVPLHKPEGVCVDGPYFSFQDEGDCDGQCRSGGLKEQNHLSDSASHGGILEAIFGFSKNTEGPGQGKGRHGLILTGHDHEGCDTWHYLPHPSTLEQASDPEVSKSQDEATFQSSSSDPASTEESGSENSPELQATPNSPQLSWNTVPFRSFSPNENNTHTSIREITLRSMMGSFGGNAALLSVWYNFEQRTWDYEVSLCALGVQHIWWAVHVVDLIAAALLIVQGCLLFRSYVTSPAGKEIVVLAHKDRKDDPRPASKKKRVRSKKMMGSRTGTPTPGEKHDSEHDSKLGS